MRIGEAAARLGLETHVLRHWEDEGVVIPRRTVHGHRDYDDEALTRAQVVLGCRGAGFSLAQIRLLTRSDQPGREDVIREQHRRVEQQVVELVRVKAFLEHVLGCRHSLMSQCPDCTRYAASADDG